MEEIVSRILPFFSTPKSYEDVLKKLAGTAFYEVYIITLILRSNPHVDELFLSIEKWGAIGRLISLIPHYEVINISGLFIAFAVSTLTYVFEFHDRLSDLVGIRETFDTESIIFPLARGVGFDIGEDLKQKIIADRHKIMHSAFYRFSSSRNEKPLVDKHDIEHALNAWSWFWIFVEGVSYFLAGCVVSIFFRDSEIGFILACVAVVTFVLALLQHSRLKKYAAPQVQRILSDADASKVVKSVFDAL
ncbi:hypothetical protein [Pleomorphomonas sp. NRK KF1]|uniref:hypothetical protein n=1 Tax=Pleomorphomonas sp. NRK KF1 TaxID=2943000 RepID=UPI0020435A44|nr:hypothetical protein [Pleomorphomonas sp. NRK KF1]MCM5554523.1 hypothetical protein [Pleomorphomonas sp. NRK KF1]